MKPNKMTDQELNEALAVEGMGRHKGHEITKFDSLGSFSDFVWYDKNDEYVITNSDWHPTHDLNQCRRLEARLPKERIEMYVTLLLNDVCSKMDVSEYMQGFGVIHASPRQKSEALLATFRGE